MTIRYKICTLLIMLLTASAQAAVNPPIVATPTAKAFFLDTVLWPYNGSTLLKHVPAYDIPVCWEKFSQSTAVNRKLVKDAITVTWQKDSLAKFIGWGQCLPSASSGIRIAVADNKNSPRAALGTQGNARVGVMLLNFTMKTLVSATSDPLFSPKKTILARCQQDNKATLETCIQSSAIHEFGHILGLAHEQNRSDDPSVILHGGCHINDIPVKQTIPGVSGTFDTLGNTLFTDYDPFSMMNYCRNRYFGRIDLSPLDKLAVRVYYGQMPSFDSRTRILRIPRIVRYDGAILTGSFNLLPDGRFQQAASLKVTTTPSKISTTLSASGILSIPEIKFISPSGHVNQVLKATLQKTTTPGVFTRKVWTRLQPTKFQPVIN
ncbi:hypothetical protein [Methyloglobulus sp.]|uniref:hypothetical protein n=1 Tax=Methyloglobulus sp. TaxID=2518622 RepID=UPI0032B780A6